MTTKAKRASIQIAGIEVEVFQLPNGEYVMSQTQIAKAVEKHDFSISRFLTSKHLESLPDNRFQSHITPIEKDWDGQGNRQDIKAVSIDVAFDYWFEQTIKGNTKAAALARACGQETLQRRCDNAFGIAKTEQQYEQQTSVALSQWQEERVKLREMHNTFTNACARYGFNAALTHDELTRAICGKSAKELRDLDLINGQWDIGLNHLDDLQDIKRVARMKYHFSRYRSGTVDERVLKAKKDVLKEEKDVLRVPIRR